MVEILGGQDFYKFQKIMQSLKISFIYRKKEKKKCDMILKNNLMLNSFRNLMINN